jgi:hypothetical protein
MKANALKKDLGRTFKLRPLPIRVWGNRRLRSSDDDWMLDEVLERPTRIRIHNIATGHTVELSADTMKGFHDPHFLILKCHLIMRPRGLDIEPILWRSRRIRFLQAIQRGVEAKDAGGMARVIRSILQSPLSAQTLSD